MQRAALKLSMILLAGLAALAAAGCDLQEDADLDNGRVMFAETCGSCHILAEAGTAGVLGPDLDAAFADSRSKGFDDDTIEGVVEAQIAFPRQTDPENPTFMEADLVTGDDATDVAAYVASVAGIPGIGPPMVPNGPGAQVFADNGCGACHVLAAGTDAVGTIGPNLDEVMPGQSDAMIEESLVDPNAQISPGFEANVMPAYADEISTEDLALLVEFLASSAGQDGGGGGEGGG